MRTGVPDAPMYRVWSAARSRVSHSGRIILRLTRQGPQPCLLFGQLTVHLGKDNGFSNLVTLSVHCSDRFALFGLIPP